MVKTKYGPVEERSPLIHLAQSNDRWATESIMLFLRKEKGKKEVRKEEISDKDSSNIYVDNH